MLTEFWAALYSVQGNTTMNGDGLKNRCKEVTFCFEKVTEIRGITENHEARFPW
jgi:hypothetical protein